VDVVESHHAEDWRMDPVRHDFLKIVFLGSGKGFLVYSEGERIPAHQGDLLVIPAGCEHKLEDGPNTPTNLYVLSIRPEVFEVAALDPALLPAGVLQLTPQEVGKTEKTVRRLLFEQSLGGPQAGARVVSLTLRLLTELIGLNEASASNRMDAGPGSHAAESDRARPSGTQSSIARMRAYVQDLDQHFFEATNLNDAAARLGISRRRFTQLFRQVTGSSWLAHIRRLRIAHARRLLVQTTRTVLSIAFECGFEDLSTFYRAFKREVGMSPNQWRAAHSRLLP
jgi:AraC family L-rhamnose operon regulatory protein RhaS